MSGAAYAREISLGDGFGDVALTVNGRRVEVHADGSVDVFGTTAVSAHPSAGDETPPRPPGVGEKMADGTIYAGLSPDTGRRMYTTPCDATWHTTGRVAMKWDEAMSFAAKFTGHGHNDWRVPTGPELNVLLYNRGDGELKHTFNETAAYPHGEYWSSSLHEGNGNYVWNQKFYKEYTWVNSGSYSSVRLVRG